MRREEFAADARAVGRAGRDTYMEALRRIAGYGPAFDAYWDNEVAAVLMAGRRPPVVSGFGAFVHSSAIEQASRSLLEQRLEGTTDRYDSHPSLSERLAALEHCAPGEPDDSPPALSVLREPEAVETALLAALFGPEAAELPAVAWDDVGREVYLERARTLASEQAASLGAAKVGELGDLAQDLARIAGPLQRHEPDLAPEAAPEFAATLLAEALLVALADAGWTVEAPLAEPVTARRGDERLNPYEVMGKLREDQAAAVGWRERAATLGIADLPLRPPAEKATAQAA
jgi:hypothetical protein